MLQNIFTLLQRFCNMLPLLLQRKNETKDKLSNLKNY